MGRCEQKTVPLDCKLFHLYKPPERTNCFIRGFLIRKKRLHKSVLRFTSGDFFFYFWNIHNPSSLSQPKPSNFRFGCFKQMSKTVFNMQQKKTISNWMFWNIGLCFLGSFCVLCFVLFFFCYVFCNYSKLGLFRVKAIEVEGHLHWTPFYIWCGKIKTPSR